MSCCAKRSDNYILVGYMAAGKSTVGKLLADRLNELNLQATYEYADTDAYIVETEGMEINQIFAEQGEDAFRKMETACLKELLKKNHRIIATGGGIVLSDYNRFILVDAGCTIFLRAKDSTVISRVSNDTTRPLLADKAGLEEKVRTMQSKRRPLYEEVADYIIDVDDKTPDEIVDEILRRTKGNY